ncbi:MAG: Rieske (2Fe-2S) protein, partial [Pseudomonadota bacterium]|nr:Rieske (2Fe-2S) protein [Pseudomonadota bacterium]
MTQAYKLVDLPKLQPLQPHYALAGKVDLVVIRWQDTAQQDQVSVLYGRCRHRGALMADAHIHGDLLTCGLHGSTYRFRTGENIKFIGANLQSFKAWIEHDSVWVDLDEIQAWEQRNPQTYQREQYQGVYADQKGTPEEPHNTLIQSLAKHGLDKVGHHGPMTSMGVPRDQLPKWDDIQLVTAQLHKRPLLDE